MLRNGSTIFFKSAEQKDGLRGYTVTGIYVVDEAAFISDEVFFETLAWVNVSQAPVVLCSTPKHKTGFFFKYYMLGLSNEPNIALCSTTGVFFSPSLSTYFKSNLAGKQKSNWQVDNVYSFPTAGRTLTSNLGP